LNWSSSWHDCCAPSAVDAVPAPEQRALTCWQQAVLGLRWFRQNAEDTAVDAESSRHPGYRYLDDVIAVLAEQAPDLHQALRRAGVGHEVNVAVSESFGDQVDQIAGQVRLRAAVPDGHRGQDGTATDATGTAVSRRS
jgi:hypothetical protein